MNIGELRKQLEKFPDTAAVILSVDVSRHGDTEAEAGRRANGSEFVDAFGTHSGPNGHVVEVVICFSGCMNDE